MHIATVHCYNIIIHFFSIIIIILFACIILIVLPLVHCTGPKYILREVVYKACVGQIL